MNLSPTEQLEKLPQSASAVTDRQADDRSMLSMLHRLVTENPSATLFIEASAEGARTVTRQEFWQRTLTLQKELQEQQVGPGDAVAVWLPNWAATLSWQFAAASLGAHVIGVNTRYNTDEVVHILELARPRVMAVAHGFLNLDLRKRLHESVARASSPAPSIAVVTGPTDDRVLEESTLSSYDVGTGVWTPGSALSTGSLEMPIDVEEPEQIVAAFTTSGSTGMPKLAAHSSAGIIHHAHSVAAQGQWGPGMVNLTALPLSGVFGYSPTMAAIASGAACLLEPVFDEHLVIRHMAEHKVTHLVCADDIVTRLAAAWETERANLSSWKVLLIGDLYGRSHEVAEWARDNFGTVTAGVYGSSELFALTAFWPLNEPLPRRWTGGGKVVSEAISVRAADPATDEAQEAGATGELQFQGPNVVDTYLGNPKATENAFTKDGWFRSGDLGVVNADGTFQYTCRLGDALRLRGFLVEPAEIEARLIAHPEVSSVKVVGLKTNTGETEAVGFVVLSDGSQTTARDLRSWCAQTLAAFKVPSTIHLVTEMPTTQGTNGSKIRVAALREMAQELNMKETER
jgi:acyl-CoA synthetase (AMP-forming)/AMP-acid ligase II